MWEKVLKREYWPAESLSLTTKPSSYIDEVYTKYTSGKEKLHVLADVYISCRPESSWEHLTSVLYEEDEITAVDEARPFLPPRGKWILLTTCKQRMILVGGHMGHGCNELDSTCWDGGHVCINIDHILKALSNNYCS